MKATELADVAAKAVDISLQYPEEVQDFVREMALHDLFIQTLDRDTKQLKYQTYYELMMKLGGPPQRAELSLPEGYEQMKAQHCYSNAWDLATNDHTLTYVEGFASHLGLLINHAWIEDGNGRIIDPTWQAEGDEPTFAYYWGVKFDTEFLIAHGHETGWASFFADDWARDVEILRLGFVMDDDNVAIGMGEL